MMRIRLGHTALGIMCWLTLGGMLAASTMTVAQRVARPIETVILTVAHDASLSPGDAVYLMTASGLEHIGEVYSVDHEQRVTLTLHHSSADRLTANTTAITWRTPLAAEDVIPALLPPSIQERIAQRVLLDWQDHEQQLASAWSPIAGELAKSFMEIVSSDVQRAVDARRDELLDVARRHTEYLADDWPAMQARLSPIIERHLTPVVSRLMSDAVADAPKIKIAWHVARGQTAQAYQVMLNWLNDYLAALPDHDRRALECAFRNTWDAIGKDPVLTERVAEVLGRVLNDGQLREILTAVYQEAVVNNPRTAHLLRQSLLESESVRARIYDFLETFGPTARGAMAILLFDETGRTRPEVVQFLRSATLQRQVSWVTLDPGETIAPPFDSSRILRAEHKGAQN